MVWNGKIKRDLFKVLFNATRMVEIGTEKQEDGTQKPQKKQKNSIPLDDCFKEHNHTETLDKDNMWYCNKCKDFVQANKTLILHRAPRILIITLKRFKTSRSRYGSSFGFG